MRLAWFDVFVDLPPVPEALLKVTALLALCWGIHAAIRRRNPRWRVFLWRGVAVAVPCLPVLGLILPRLHVPVVSHVETGSAPAVPPEVSWETPPWAEQFRREESAAVTFVAASPGPVTLSSAAPSSTGLVVAWLRDHGLACLAAVWGSIACVLTFLAARVSARLHRVVTESRESPPWACRLLCQVSADLHCRRKVVLRSSTAVASPTLTGLFRPVILVPESFSDPGLARDLRAVLAHELGHLQNGDLAWTQLLQALAIVFWFHPLMWRVGSAHAAACEEVCDGLAAVYIGDPDDYRGTLARVALAALGRCPVPGGVPMARRPHLRTRLERLKQRLSTMPLPRRGLAACLLGGCLALSGLGGLTFTSAQEDPPIAPDGVAASDVPPSSAAGSHILRFPKDRSVGTLFVQDENAVRRIESFHHWIDGTTWEGIGPAMGDVAIPAGKRVRLVVSAAGCQDMSFLASLRPDDLYDLTASGIHALGARPTDAGLRHAAHLTGVRVLNLHATPITAAGLKHLSKLRSLERIHLPEGTNDATLKLLRSFPRLKAVYLFTSQISDAGFAEFEALGQLEELELGGKRLTGAALRRLPRLRSLQYLFLHGPLPPDAVAKLQAPSSLRALCLDAMPVGDAGMEAISWFAQLENLSVHSAADVTDRGVGHLARLPNLRKLDVGSARLTDDGLRALGRIRSLEHLTLPALGLTDAGLAHVAGLGNLQFLSVAGFTNSPLTDETLARLTELRKLEELNIGGAFTDEGLARLGGMQSLKVLSLTCAPHDDPRVTNAGLVHLGRLTRLQHLSLSNLKQCTLSGLSSLGNLADLRILHVRGLRQDQRGMDLTGLIRLEDLLIRMYGQRVGPNVKYEPMLDEDLRSLSKLHNLRRIQLSHDGFTDRGLEYLSGLANAEFINLGGPGITDAGFAAFANLPRLNWLRITGGEITGRALAHLKAARSLERLEIKSDHAIAPEAVAALKARLPHLTDVQVHQ